MPRTCSVCQHPQRGDIDAALRTDSFRKVAARFGTSTSATFRHKTSCGAAADDGTVSEQPAASAAVSEHRKAKARASRPHDEKAGCGDERTRARRPPLADDEPLPKHAVAGTEPSIPPEIIERALEWPRRRGTKGRLIPTEPAVVAAVVVDNALLDLRLQGLSCVAIGRELGLHEDAVAERLRTLLARLQERNAAKVELLRELEIARCDRMQEALWKRALRAPKKLLGGRDFQAQDKAVERITKLMERRARYIPGLEVPEKQQLEHTGAGGAPLGASPELQLLYQRAQAGDEAALAALDAYAATGRLPPADGEPEVVEGTADPVPDDEALPAEQDPGGGDADEDGAGVVEEWPDDVGDEASAP